MSKVNLDFLIEKVEVTTQSVVTRWGYREGSCMRIINANSTNHFLKRYETLKEKPWLTKCGNFLLFDFVHFLKNIRNLWLTEKMGELVFEDNDVQRAVTWSHLKQLYELDSKTLAQMLNLTEASIECQKVSTSLNVLCNTTLHALLNHSSIRNM